MPASFRAEWQGLDEYQKILKQTLKEIQKEASNIVLASGLIGLQKLKGEFFS